jgi:peroxiredoxin
MRPDIVPEAIFPDYELSDHTGKRGTLSELQGQHPMVLVLSRGGFCPKDRRPDWDITTRELKAEWQQGRKELFYPNGKTYAQALGEQE